MICHIWYRKDEAALRESSPPVTTATLEQSHAHVAEVDLCGDVAYVIDVLNAAYDHMNKVWPLEDRRAVIEAADMALPHTSMSVGDVVQMNNGQCFEVLRFGFRRLDAGWTIGTNGKAVVYAD